MPTIKNTYIKEEPSPEKSCCQNGIRKIGLENTRMITHGLAMILYLLGGAVFFSSLEWSNEQAERQHYQVSMTTFLETYPEMNRSDLYQLLEMHALAHAAGLSPNKSLRWDFYGALNFVGTVVSTIGFGITTPRTIAGKICLIFYGSIGCSGAILFFNLFLERIINFFIIVLRVFNNCKRCFQSPGRKNSNYDVKEQAVQEINSKPEINTNQPETQPEENNDVELEAEEIPVNTHHIKNENWKPSIYIIQMFLFVTATVIALVASQMYTAMESWSFLDSIYFCFVAFSTIGFGDFVAMEHTHYSSQLLYRIVSFLFLSFGCCCIYSFFNVTSLMIRSGLDYCIYEIKYKFVNCWHQKTLRRQVLGRTNLRKKRNPVFEENAINPADIELFRNGSKNSSHPSFSYTSSGSGELIAIRGFLKSNQFALAMLQKQLCDAATTHKGHRASHSSDNGLRAFSPLAIVDQQFGDNDDSSTDSS